MFHFEIEAEFLTDEALLFLKTVPPGVMQFEIGVQSTNKKTLCAVGRSQNVETLFENIAQIPRTIHSHLDLIAGLPFEDLKSFGKSFDLTMELKPDALQLGFLKILHGKHSTNAVLICHDQGQYHSYRCQRLSISYKAHHRNQHRQ